MYKHCSFFCMPDKLFVVKEYRVAKGPINSGEVIMLPRSASSQQIGEAVVLAIEEFEEIESEGMKNLPNFVEQIVGVYGYKNYRAFYGQIEQYLSIGFDGKSITVRPLEKDGRGFVGVKEKVIHCGYNASDVGLIIVDMID